MSKVYRIRIEEVITHDFDIYEADYDNGVIESEEDAIEAARKELEEHNTEYPSCHIDVYEKDAYCYCINNLKD